MGELHDLVGYEARLRRMGINQLGEEAERVGVIPDWLSKAELIAAILKAQHLDTESLGEEYGNQNT